MKHVDLNTGSETALHADELLELPVTASWKERSAAVAAAVQSGCPIAIPFAKFSDGRGFSVAHLLRSEHGYRGKLIATGHTIPDQVRHLVRTGFDTVQVKDASRLPHWQKSLVSYRSAYQSALRNPVALRRAASAIEKSGSSSASTLRPTKRSVPAPGATAHVLAAAG